MAQLKNVLDELHRRSLWQVLGVYVAASWGVLEFVDFLADNVGLPPWVLPLAMALCAIGLPIVLATAFVQQGHPLQSRVEADPTLLPGFETTIDEASPRPLTHRVFTWRRALLGGAMAFVVLAVGTAGFMLLRELGIGPAASLLAAGRYDSSDRVVLADFASPAEVKSTADMITEALRVDLQQSNAFALVDPAEVQQVLVLMKHEAETRLTRDIAKEIAQREAYKLVLSGNVGRVGTGWLLTAHLIDAQSGETLASFDARAEGDDELLRAVDGLSGSIRTKMGEAYRSVNASEPLERVTTRSLPALLRYTAAERIVTSREPANGRSAIELLREAVSLDTTFAMAYRKLGTQLSNAGLVTQAREAFIAAFRHRDRLTELERYLAEGLYYDVVAGDERRAAQAHRRALEIDPNQKSALNNLTFQATHTGNTAEGIASGERGIRQPYPYVTQYFNLGRAYIAAGRTADALPLADSMFARTPGSRYGYLTQVNAAANDFDYARIDSIARFVIAAGPQRMTLARYQASLWRSQALAATGRAREADAELAGMLSVFTTSTRRDRRLMTEIDRAMFDAKVRRDETAALHRLRQALRTAPIDSMGAYDVPGLELAYAFAQLGATAEAEAWLQRQDGLRAPEAPFKEQLYMLTRAQLLMNARNYNEAVAELERAERAHACVACIAMQLAEAHDLNGNRDAAIAQYRRYLDTPYAERLPLDALQLPQAYFRLGELLQQRGDGKEAAAYYGKFVDLWANADADLQPRVQAARARLSDLTGRR